MRCKFLVTTLRCSAVSQIKNTCRLRTQNFVSSTSLLSGVDAERLRYRTKEYLINIIKESKPEEFENNEAGHQIETKDLEDKFMSTLLEFPDKNSGVNQTEQFLRESPPILKHFDLSVFSNDTIKDLSIKFNTPIPSSAAVERFFQPEKMF